MANSAISWASQQQKPVALSVGEAEYMELSSTGQQAAWLKSFSGEIGFSIEGPILSTSKPRSILGLVIL